MFIKYWKFPILKMIIFWIHIEKKIKCTTIEINLKTERSFTSLRKQSFI